MAVDLDVGSWGWGRGTDSQSCDRIGGSRCLINSVDLDVNRLVLSNSTFTLQRVRLSHRDPKHWN